LEELLKGPIPTPSFSAYVSASTALSTAIPIDSLPRIFSESSFGRQWGNLLTLGTLHLSPRNEVAEQFWSYLNETYPLVMTTAGSNATILRVRVHDDEVAALDFIDKNNLNERTWALLDFSQFNLEEESSAFKIRMNYTTVPNTARITRWASIGLNDRYQRYYLSGYMTLQRTINEFAMAQSGCEEDLSSIISAPMPTAAYSQNPFFLQVGYLLGFTMVMAFLYPTSRLIKTIVEEKETKMKETLLILGVRGWAHWLSWFISSLVVFFIITVSVTFTLTSTVLVHSNPVYIFLYVLLFSTSNIGFCFAIASFFSRAKLAGIIGPVALFATILPRFVFFGSNRYENTSGQMIASLCPATAFCFGADIISDYEYAEQGIQSWNSGEGDYSFDTTLAFLFLDTLLYIFLGWYLDQVVPQQYGVARPFYFLFTPSYWLGSCTKKPPPPAPVAGAEEGSVLGIICVFVFRRKS
jgi:ATP-binding cassette subfamily A (ABC1) protein 3